MDVLLLSWLSHVIQCTDKVYLIFSANKPGEYFGFARMLSRIDGNSPQSSPVKSIKNPKPYELSLPTVTVTPATSSAPKGSVTEDLYRGTIFWEADLDGPEGSGSTPKLERENEHGKPVTDKSWKLVDPLRFSASQQSAFRSIMHGA